MPVQPSAHGRPEVEGDRLLAGLEELATAVSGATDPAEVGRCVVEVACRHLGAWRGAAFAADTDGRLVLVWSRADRGDPAENIAPTRERSRGHPIGDAMLDGGVRLFEDANAFATAYPRVAPLRGGTGPLVVIGLGRPGAVACVVALSWESPGSLSQAGRGFLDTMARVATQAMDRIVAENRERRRAEGLSRTLAAVAAESRPSAIAAALLAEAMPAADAAFGTVRLVSADGSTTTLVGDVGYEGPNPYADLPLTSGSPATDAIRSGQAVILPGPAAIAERYPEWVAAFASLGPQASASLPISQGGTTIGALSLGWREPQGFDPGQLAYVRALADAASAALERARAAEEEARLRQLLGEVLRQLPIGVLVAEPGVGLVFQSDEVARILGGPLPTGPLSALTVQRSYPDGRPIPAEEWPIARALLGEPTEGFESLFRRLDDDREVRILSSARPILREGRISAAVSVFADVTDERDAAEARDAFLGVLSHELRTPLTSVYGGALVLERHRGELPAAFEPVVAGIAHDAARLLRLVEDLLVLARIERGAELATREPVSLAPVLRRSARAEADRWPGVEVAISVDPETPPALADEGPLEVVVRNLVGNAAKFGARHIEVSARPEDGGVAVRVADDGPGLDLGPDDMFRLFRRGPNAVRRAPGSGIGLYVSRALVVAMGGEIEAGDRPGGGAEFTVHLAAAPDDE